MESPITLKNNYWQSRVSECAEPAMNGTGKVAVDYSIVPVSNRDGDRVIDFLRRFFFRDEPLNVCVGLLDGPHDTCAELEQYCVDSIPDGVSLMAVSPNGNILGVCINGILKREQEDCENEKDSKNEADECSNPKFRKILKLLKTVYQESNVFGQFKEVDKLLDIRVASVDDACRGHGIAKALFDRTKLLAQELGIPLVRVDCTSHLSLHRFDRTLSHIVCCRLLAQELGIPLVRVDCTSHFSAKAVARLGFHCVYTLQYSEYLDSEGEPVFVPELPHTCVKTFVCPIPVAQ